MKRKQMVLSICHHKKLPLEIRRRRITFGKGNAFRSVKYGDGLVCAIDYLGMVHTHDLKQNKNVGKLHHGRIIDFTILSRSEVETVVNVDGVLRIVTMSLTKEKFEKTDSIEIDFKATRLSLSTLNGTSFIFNYKKGFIFYDKSAIPTDKCHISPTCKSEWDELSVRKIDRKRQWAVTTRIFTTKSTIDIWDLRKEGRMELSIPWSRNEGKGKYEPVYVDLNDDNLIFDDNEGYINFYSLKEQQVTRKLESYRFINRFHKLINIGDSFVCTCGEGGEMMYFNSKNEKIKTIEKKHTRNIHSLILLDELHEDKFPLIMSSGFDSTIHLWRVTLDEVPPEDNTLSQLFVLEFCVKCKIEVLAFTGNSCSLKVPKLFVLTS